MRLSAQGGVAGRLKMLTRPVTVDPETDIEDVAKLTVDKKYHTLPVMEGDKVVGIVGKEDVLKTLLLK